MALAFLLALVLIVSATIYLFVVHPFWFPAGISAEASALDHQFRIALWLLGGLFVAGQVILAFFLIRSSKSSWPQSPPARPVSYSKGDWRAEIIWTVLIAVLFFWFNLAGEKVWSEMKMHPAQPGAIPVEVTGVQFQWYFRYPGADGKLGRTDPQQFARPEEGNPLGLDPADPAGQDDIVSGTLVLPAGHEVDLTLRAQDVIHSLFIPALRFKQDTVPGMEVHAHFRPLRTGEYEIACAELCGLGHYRMRSSLRVVNEDEYARWLNEHQPAGSKGAASH